MSRALALCVCALLFPAVLALAEDAPMDRNPADRPPADANPADANPADTKPADTQSPEAKPAGEQPDAKKLSGMSIVGNDDAPKSLYIVPWKGSEIGAETSLDTMLNEGEVPVDREVFRRQLEYYKVSTRK